MPWFQLNTGGDPTNPADYTSAGTPSCSGSGKICAVNANPSGNNPILTDALKNEMILSLHTGIAQPNVKLRGTA